MVKKIAVTLLILVAAGFAFDWGIYGGPGVTFTLTNMSSIHDVIVADANSGDPNFPGYDVSSFAPYQIGLSTPIALRLWNFTIGWGDSYSWQTFKGSDWKTTFHHRLDITEFGYVVNLNEHMRFTPLFGLGDYDINMTIAELGGGFAAPKNENGVSHSYDYNNFSLTAGAAFAYLWKIEDRVVIGLQAKARYLVPLSKIEKWDADGSYDNAIIEDFYPHTPIVGLNFFIGYERVGEEGFWEDDWPDE